MTFGGLGKLDNQAMNRLLTGKSWGFSFNTLDDGYSFTGWTTPADLETELQVLAAFVSDPGLRRETFERIRTNVIWSLPSTESTPMGVYGQNITALLHGGDPRWRNPTLEEVKAVKYEDFRALVEPALRQGPIEVTLVGDIWDYKVIPLVAATFGALPARSGQFTRPGEIRMPVPGREPMVLKHRGKADQGVAAAAFAMPGQFIGGKASAAQNILAAIVQDRLKDLLRERAGVSYGVQVRWQTSTAFASYGVLLAQADIPPAKASLFFDGLGRIATALGERPPSADEMERARNPKVVGMKEALKFNGYLSAMLATVQREPRLAAVIREALPGLEGVTDADVQKVAKQSLGPDKMWKLVVRPAGPRD